MSGLEFIDQRSVGDVGTPLSDLFDTQEIDLRFAGIAEFEKTAKVSNEPLAPFITQGFVTGIATQLREHYLFVNKARFGAHLPPVDLPLELQEGFQELVIGSKDDPYIQLSILVGHEAVRLVDILDNIATPARNLLQQGSSIELLEVKPNVVRPHTNSEHPIPHAHAGSYGAYLPIAWIGRILGNEGTLDLKSVKPRIGTSVVKSLWNE